MKLNKLLGKHQPNIYFHQKIKNKGKVCSSSSRYFPFFLSFVMTLIICIYCCYTCTPTSYNQPYENEIENIITCFKILHEPFHLF